MWLKLLHGDLAVVDEREPGALSATELRAEAEAGDGVLWAFVELAEFGAEVFLADIRALRVEDVSVERERKNNVS